MKNAVKALVAISLVAVMLLCLVSCGNKPSGEYGNKVLSLTFKGSDVTVNVIGVIEVKGTFEMGDDNEIVITYENDDAKGKVPTNLVYDKENDEIDCKLGILSYSLEKVED